MTEQCQRCKRDLHPDKMVWLELDQRDLTYHDFKDVPSNVSQGWFAFGPDCAARERRNAAKVRKQAA